jgi:hypothetical protein
MPVPGPSCVNNLSALQGIVMTPIPGTAPAAFCRVSPESPGFMPLPVIRRVSVAVWPFGSLSRCQASDPG